MLPRQRLAADDYEVILTCRSIRAIYGVDAKIPRSVPIESMMTVNTMHQQPQRGERCQPGASDAGAPPRVQSKKWLEP